MNAFALAQAVALHAVPLVHEACTNKDEMLASIEWGDDRIEPDWWLCNDRDDVEGRPFRHSNYLIPIVRLHPARPQDNERLCAECRGIFEDPELYWPFLARDNEAIRYRGWVDFVAEEVVFEKTQQVWLCAKLLGSSGSGCR